MEYIDVSKLAAGKLNLILTKFSGFIFLIQYTKSMKYKFNFKETFNIGKKFFQEYVFNTLTLRSALLSLLF